MGSMLWKPETWPQARFKVQLGRIMAKNNGQSSEWADKLDEGYDGRMKDVETDYARNVWGKPGIERNTGGLSAWSLSFGSVGVVLAIGTLAVLRCSRAH